MNTLSPHERCSLALLTDLYQLTMAYGYWKSAVADREAVFCVFFRQHPFGGGYTLAAGLEQAIDFVERFCFNDDDLAYLATLCGNDGKPLFEPAFLEHLRALRFSCSIDAIPEGTVVFPHEPLLRIQGPIIQCQLLETVLLTILNFQTLIATKAARICLAARGEPVIEFGLRRAQGIDGGLSASRAAYIGGAAGTSNVLAGKLFGIPVMGTHAHSWVMLFGDELEAFERYAEALPNNAIFLVDTYNSLEGVRHAVAVGRRLRERGHRLAGIRLDSGDLAWLSIEARKILDGAGFTDAVIVGSNDLDEQIITSLKEQDARINVWGVGTRLVTAYDQPSLGGVYKLTAIRRPGGPWQPRLKLSEQLIKINNPGRIQVRRFREEGLFAGDMIYDIDLPGTPDALLVDPLDPTRQKRLTPQAPGEDLLVPIFREGRRVYELPTLAQIRERVRAQLAGFHPGVKRLVNPHEYPVGLEPNYHDLKTELILQARGLAPH